MFYIFIILLLILSFFILNWSRNLPKRYEKEEDFQTFIKKIKKNKK